MLSSLARCWLGGKEGGKTTHSSSQGQTSWLLIQVQPFSLPPPASVSPSVSPAASETETELVRAEVILVSNIADWNLSHIYNLSFSLTKVAFERQRFGYSRGLLSRAVARLRVLSDVGGLRQEDLVAGDDVGAGHHHPGRVHRDVAAALAGFLDDDLLRVLVSDGAAGFLPLVVLAVSLEVELHLAEVGRAGVDPGDGVRGGNVGQAERTSGGWYGQ